MFKYQGAGAHHGAGEPGRAEGNKHQGRGKRGGRGERGAGRAPGTLTHKLHPPGRGSNPLPLLTEPPIFVHLPRGMSFFP